jgi:hypothetical protein
MHLYNLFIWEIDKTECISVVGTILQDEKKILPLSQLFTSVLK